MATVYFGLVTMLSDSGLATAVVTLRQLKDEQISQINSLSVLLGVACFLISLLAAGPLAVFYRNPQVQRGGVRDESFVPDLGVSGDTLMPCARENFVSRRLPGWTAQAILQSLSTVVFALSGLGYWSLVYGGLVGISSSTMLFVWLHPKSFAWPHLDALRETLVFGKHILVGRISWFVSGNSDFVVAGRVLGEAALGAYNLAWQLASVPIDKISSMISQVTPAFFSAQQNEPAGLRRYLLRITEGLAMVTLPLSLGVALVADDFVRLVLGKKWEAAIVPLALLACSTSFRSITPLVRHPFERDRTISLLNVQQLGECSGVAHCLLRSQPLGHSRNRPGVDRRNSHPGSSILPPSFGYGPAVRRQSICKCCGPRPNAVGPWFWLF